MKTILLCFLATAAISCSSKNGAQLATLKDDDGGTDGGGGDDAVGNQNKSSGSSDDDGSTCLSDCSGMTKDTMTQALSVQIQPLLSVPGALASPQAINDITTIVNGEGAPKDKASSLVDLARSYANERYEGDPDKTRDTGGDTMVAFNKASEQMDFSMGFATSMSYNTLNPATGVIATSVTQAVGHETASNLLIALGEKFDSALGTLFGGVVGGASVDSKDSTSNTTTVETKSTNTVNTPPLPRQSTTLTVCTPHGEITVPISSPKLLELGGEATFSLEAGMNGHGRTAVDTANEAQQQAQWQAEQAQRDAARVEAQKTEWDAILAGSKTFYFLSSDGSEWLPFTGQMMGSFQLIYEDFALRAVSVIATYQAAYSNLNSAINSFNENRSQAVTVVNQASAAIQPGNLSIADLVNLDSSLVSAKAQHCPEIPLDWQPGSLLHAIDEWDNLKSLYQTAVDDLSKIVDVKAMNSFVASRDATFNPGRDLLQHVPDTSNRVCDQFGVLRQAIVAAIELRQIQGVDSSVAALSASAVRQMKQSGHDLAVGDLTSALDEEVDEISQALASARIHSHLNEALVAEAVAKSSLAGSIIPQINASTILTDDEKTTLIRRETERTQVEIDHLDSSIQTNGYGSFVYERMQNMDDLLRSTQSRIKTMKPDQAANLMAHWIEIVTSSGPKIAPECTDPKKALADFCWEMSIPIDGASDAKLQVYDGHLAELEVGIQHLLDTANALENVDKNK